jgi:hypothetical protein
VVLDLWIEPLPKFQGNVGSLKISSMLDEFAEVVNIFINISAALEEPRSFEFSPRSLDFVLGAEVDNKFVYKFPPRPIGQTSDIMIAVHLAVHKMCCSSTFYEGEGPHDLCMIVRKLVGYKCHIELTRVEECASLHVIASKLIRPCWFDMSCASCIQNSFIREFRDGGGVWVFGTQV